MKIAKRFLPKIVIFTAVKNRCILHGHVFVMIFISDRYKVVVLMWFILLSFGTNCLISGRS